MQKDLVNIKRLAAVLEVEGESLRKLRVEAKPSGTEGSKANGEAKDGDTIMEEPVIEHDEDPEPRERGSDAVEARVEKILGDMREQGVLDGCDDQEVEAKRVSPRNMRFRLTFSYIWYLQTIVALDLYLAYLRAAFHTCYYCAVVTDHSEELQRKCVKHVRKPLSKLLQQEMKAAETQKASEPKVEGEAEKEGEKPREKEKDQSNKDKQGESRDWKRNGWFGPLRSGTGC